jgi:hypothetical protein
MEIISTAYGMKRAEVLQDTATKYWVILHIRSTQNMTSFNDDTHSVWVISEFFIHS